MAKKIAITGTHGVGKTTMAMQMASEIKSGDPSLRVNVLPEAARMCPFPLNKKNDGRGATVDLSQAYGVGNRDGGSMRRAGL